MIPAIAYMIGAYILMRCLVTLTRTGEREEHIAARVAAGAVFFVTIVLMYMVYHIEATSDIEVPFTP